MGSPMRYQPQGRVRINQSSKFARSLVGAVLPGSGRGYEIVSGTPYGTFGTRPSLVMSPAGQGWQGGSLTLPVSMSPVIGQAQITVIAVLVRTGSYSAYCRVMDCGGDSTSSGGWDIEATSNGAALNLVAWANGTPTGATAITPPLNTLSVLAFSNDGATTRSYLNGALQGTSGASMTPATTGGRGPISIGTDRGGGNSGAAGQIYGIFVFNRVLSDADIASLSANPWQVFDSSSSSSAYQSAIASPGASNTSVTPGAASFALTGYAPTIVQGVTNTVAPSAGSLGITGYAPSVTQGMTTAVSPAPAALGIAGYAPTVTQTAAKTVNPAPAGLVITGYAPTVTRGASLTIAVGAPATLALTGYAPTISQANNITPHMQDATIMQLSAVRSVANIGPDRLQQTVNLIV